MFLVVHLDYRHKELESEQLKKQTQMLERLEPDILQELLQKQVDQQLHLHLHQ